MKVLQVNLNRCINAHNLLKQFILENGIDLCLVSEPNIFLSQEWSGMQNTDARIWKSNANIYAEREGCGTGFSWLETEKIIFVSLYSSGNERNEILEMILNEVSTLKRSTSKEVVIGGDFNAKSPSWGSNILNHRGRIVMEWIESENLIISNQGNTPTFKKRNMESVIDITLVTEGLSQSIENWNVLDDFENGADHQYIRFDIELTENRLQHRDRHDDRGWNLKSFDVEQLKILMRNKNEDDIRNPEDLTALIAEMCSKTMKKKGNRRRREAHWWNESINNLRKDCNKARRICTRLRRTSSEEEWNRLYLGYKNKRTNLNTEMTKAKKEGWKKLCLEVERDVWGLAYKIVTKKIGRHLLEIPAELRQKIISELFPAHPITNWDDIDLSEDNLEEINTDELLKVIEKINPRKAPGPDGVPSKVIKEMILINPAIFQKVFNSLIQTGQFPQNWKEAKVILIEKPKKNPSDGPKFRPICLLNTIGKLYESVLNERLKRELEDNNLLSDRQYGFRSGMSTINAITQVKNIAKKEMDKTYRKRKLCALITIDIKNAFNSANWKIIDSEMKRMNISKHIIKSIESYLKDRKIVGEEFSKWMTAGVPQGSVLGPTLWNILYNSVLELGVPEGTNLLAYADDLAIVIVGKNANEVESKANEAMEIISAWMRRKNLQIAPEKSELMILSGRKKCRPLNIELEGTRLKERPQIKYLGVILDRSLKFGPHLEHVCEKAAKTTKALTKILPRIGGAGESKRRVLQTAAESIILYAAPVWAECLNIKKRREQILRAQRTGALRVCSGYRTISTEAVTVISGIIPLDLMLEERAKTFLMSKEGKDREREITLAKWQFRWDNGVKGAWTRTLIKDVTTWIHRGHGEVDYHTTQILSGHGCFEFYKHRFKLAVVPNCRYCNTAEDTAEHTMFLCSRWERERTQMSLRVGENVTKNNMINLMLEGRNNWNEISNFIKTIMKRKEEDERTIRLQSSSRLVVQ